MVDYLTHNWNGIEVSYTRELDGGGLEAADDCVAVIRDLKRKPKPGRIFEWCCGPGFIGYALLANGLGTSLCLSDIFPPAVDCARHTAKANNIEGKVDVYLGDNLEGLPDHEKFDLVISNPPQFQNRLMLEKVFPHETKTDPRIYVDWEWKLHKKFFREIRDHLNPNGLIALIECSGGAHVETFRPMLEGTGLVIAGWEWPHLRIQDMFYLYIRRDDATERFEI